MAGVHGATGFTDEQRSGLRARQSDRDRTLEAMHRLEAALAEAAPRREKPWRDAVLRALDDLEEVTAEEAANAERPDSLLSDLSRNQPRMRNRARALRLQYQKVRGTVDELRREIASPGEDATDYADVRQRLGWVLTALRHQRARESDLIYEAYFDAFHDELRTGGAEDRR
jgi:ATP phosphoribosyltransferase regulatory subunit HisZ